MYYLSLQGMISLSSTDDETERRVVTCPRLQQRAWLLSVQLQSYHGTLHPRTYIPFLEGWNCRNWGFGAGQEGLGLERWLEAKWGREMAHVRCKSEWTSESSVTSHPITESTTRVYMCVCESDCSALQRLITTTLVLFSLCLQTPGGLHFLTT